jgi:hypothetical protein
LLFPVLDSCYPQLSVAFIHRNDKVLLAIINWRALHMPLGGRHVCKEGKPSFGRVGHGVAPLSFSRGNDGAFVESSLVIKHLFTAKGDARSVEWHDWP